MKKLISILLAGLLLIGVLVIPAAAADDEAAAISYADAEYGSLLYTVDFRGDDVFKPVDRQGMKSAQDKDLNPTIMSYTPSEDGKTLTIKGNGGDQNQENFWGGAIAGLEANGSTVYSMVYQIKNNCNSGDSSVGIGGWSINDTTNKFYNNYSNHNTGDTVNQKTALSYGGQKSTSYKFINQNEETRVDYALTDDGFMTMMVVYDGTDYSFKSYVLASFMGSGNMEEDWIPLQTYDMGEAVIWGNDVFGFYTYAFYAQIETVVRDVKVYKGTPYASPEDEPTIPVVTVPETEPVTEPTTEPVTEPTTEPTTEPVTEPTTEPVTEPTTEPVTEPTTEPAVTTPATTEPANTDKPAGGGCGGFTAVATFIALICGAGAAIVIKKK